MNEPRPATVVCGSCGEQTRGHCVRHMPRKGRSTHGGIKRTAADDRFSKMIRTRDNFRCTVCGAQHESNSMGLHAMHCFSRGKKGLRPGHLKHSINCCLRHDTDNAAAGCWSCHRKIDDDPALKEAHFRSILGDERYEELSAKAHTTQKSVKRRTA